MSVFYWTDSFCQDTYYWSAKKKIYLKKDSKKVIGYFKKFKGLERLRNYDQTISDNSKTAEILVGRNKALLLESNKIDDFINYEDEP